MYRSHSICFFFFNDTTVTDIYTLSLHDALPIFDPGEAQRAGVGRCGLCDQALRSGRTACPRQGSAAHEGDRKSTRLNSSHLVISYAVFCLKKKISDMYS